MERKISVLNFVKRAIKTLRDPRYKGLHVVFSGFNAAFRAYYPNMDPKKELQKLEDAGEIVVTPVKGGVMIYLTSQVSPRISNEDVLKKMRLI